MTMGSISAAHQVQVAVVGAGAVGLAVARKLAMMGKEVLVLDRASVIGSETSSRNSEVIHGGLYYPFGSKKARFCVSGKGLLYEYCRSHNIPHNRCGKLIVATTREQLETDLPVLKDKALRNGVSDVRVLSQQDVKELEPQVECKGALWSPSTGVIDSHSFMLSLLGDIENNGGTWVPNAHVQGGMIGTNGGIHIAEDGTWLTCRALVNCTGLNSHAFASMIHNEEEEAKSSASWRVPKQFFAKGNYFRLEGCKPPFRHLVYPIPEPGGLGVHATIDWSGTTCRFGPDVEWLDADTRPDEIDLDVDPSRAHRFYEQVRKYWPQLRDDSLVPDYAGIRPKLQHPSTMASKQETPSFVDFLIQGPKDHGIPGLFHMLGIESPGLTSSMAIAEYIALELNDK